MAPITNNSTKRTCSKTDNTEPEELPNGWQERFSNSRKLPYYVNMHTKESFWELPTRPASQSPRLQSRLQPKVDQKTDGSSSSSSTTDRALRNVQNRSRNISRATNRSQSRLDKLRLQLQEDQNRNSHETPRPAVPASPSSKTSQSKIPEAFKTPTPSSRNASSSSIKLPAKSLDLPETMKTSKRLKLNASAQLNKKDDSAHCWFSQTRRQQSKDAAAAPQPTDIITPIANSRSMMQTISKMTNQVLSAFSKRQFKSVPADSSRSKFLPINSETADTPSPNRSSIHRSPRTPCNNRLTQIRDQLTVARLSRDKAGGNDDVQMTDENENDGQGAASANNNVDDDAMDWEECMHQTAGTVIAGPIADRVVVLDTNVLIGDLALVRQIMNEQVRASDLAVSRQRIQLLVPYMVLKELDGIKMQRNESKGRQAQNAIRLVHEAIKTGDWCLQAERPGNSRTSDNESNDECILKCALQAQRDRVDNKGQVCLLSDDVNLRNFAILHDVPTMSTAEWRRNDAGARGSE